VLFHHFMTKTSEAMQDDLIGSYPWVGSIAAEATQCAYLMHEILAVAAIHLKCLSPDHQQQQQQQQQQQLGPLDYERLAQEHQSRALSLFRVALASDSAANEAGRLFTCSSLIVRFYFVAIEDPAALLFRDDEQGLPEWIPPLRGCGALARQFADALATSPLGGLVLSSADFWSGGGPVRRPCESDSQVQLLEHRLSGLTTLEEQASLYGPALAELRDCFAVSELGTDLATKAAAFAFPTRVAPDFLTALCHDKHPASLVIMAHWCVLLQRIYPKWWIRSISTVADMVQAIRVRLPGPEWEELIHWPMSQIFIPGATGKAKMVGIDPSLSG